MSLPPARHMAVFYSYPQYVFHPLTSLGLLRLVHQERGKAQEAVVCEWDCTLEICLQTYCKVLLLLSLSGLPNAVTPVDTGLLYLWGGMQKET